jgi:hypothetical protein
MDSGRQNIKPSGTFCRDKTEEEDKVTCVNEKVSDPKWRERESSSDC